MHSGVNAAGQRQWVMPRKKKTSPEKAETVSTSGEWSYQITITRTKPRTVLSDGKLSPARVEPVYQSILHQESSPDRLLADATKALTSINAVEST